MQVVSSLQDMILSLEQGTHLHISVLFFVPVHKILQTDFPHAIHSSPFCDAAKQRPRGMYRCMRCKTYATEKARRGEAFGGFCINGVYEYCQPVSVEGQTVAVVFTGNLVSDAKVFAFRNFPYPVAGFLPHMETSLTPAHCRRTAETVASYVRMLYQQFPIPASDRSGYLVQRMKEYAADNFLFDLPLSRLAELFHYNEKYLGRKFKEETGETFRQYVNLLRLRHARKMLHTTTSDVVEIALASGFDNVSYFNRLFKARYGITPTEYRKSAV
ncbi:MAG: helix-turn-helix domain-containing protein [Clostridia bacterium]|nr:helix-turn-helix domain-containing protein [Clostridia bacterium]